MAQKKMIDLRNLWKDKNLSYQLKIKIMKTLVWTTITYGAEGWTLKTDDKKKIQAAEMWCYRRLANVSWKDKRTNRSILEELNTHRELFGLVVKRKMTYFGHMSRNRNLNITKTIVQGKPEGKRGRGRPRTAYLDNIREWTGLTSHEAFQATHNREDWREICMRATRAANAHLDDAG